MIYIEKKKFVALCNKLLLRTIVYCNMFKNQLAKYPAICYIPDIGINPP
jgi:hypothetical protein